MFFEKVTEHHWVVHVYKAGLPLECPKDGVHHSLERGGWREDFKWQYLKLVEAIQLDEFRLFWVASMNFDFPVASF